MGYGSRLWSVLVLGLLCWGIGCYQDTAWASPFDSREDAEFLELGMEGHELVQTARLNEDAAEDVAGGKSSDSGESSKDTPEN